MGPRLSTEPTARRPDEGELRLLAAVVGRRAAGELLTRHPLAALPALDRRTLLGLPHVGPARAAAILALPRLLEAVARGAAGHGPLSSSREVFERYRLTLGAEASERFLVLALNSRNAVLAEEVVAVGTVNAVHVNPAQVLRPAVLHAAGSLLCLHNHPSGDPNPSPEDHALTGRIAGAAALMGLRLLDHVIVTPSAYYSFSDAGRL